MRSSSSSLLSAAFFAGAFFGAGCDFVLPDALRAVVALDPGLAAALDEPAAAAGFLSKKSVTDGWAADFVFLAGLIYASLSSSLSPLLQGEKERKKSKLINENHKETTAASTYDLRLLAWVWEALPLPFSSAARTRSSPESESASFEVGVAFFCFGGGCGSSVISTSELDSILGGRFFAVGAVGATVLFFGGGGRSSSRLTISSSSSDSFLAFGLARDAPPAGAMGLLRALAAAAFFVGIKSSYPSESPPPMRLPGPEPPIDFRVLSVACFRLTFLPLESTTALSSHSWHAFCRQGQHVFP